MPYRLSNLKFDISTDVKEEQPKNKLSMCTIFFVSNRGVNTIDVIFLIFLNISVIY